MGRGIYRVGLGYLLFKDVKFCKAKYRGEKQSMKARILNLKLTVYL